MDLRIDISNILRLAGNVFLQYLKAELVVQGHNNTGKLLESLMWNIEGEKVDVLGLFYAKILNDGVPKENVSFAQAYYLAEYFKTKGYSEAEAKSFAFATINKWKKTGMPTQGKRKLHAIDKAIRKSQSTIDKLIERELDKQITAKLKMI